MENDFIKQTSILNSLPGKNEDIDVADQKLTFENSLSKIELFKVNDDDNISKEEVEKKDKEKEAKEKIKNEKISSVPSMMRCYLCEDFCEDGVQIVCCNEIFCKKHITEEIMINFTCPNCKKGTSLKNIIINKKLNENILWYKNMLKEPIVNLNHSNVNQYYANQRNTLTPSSSNNPTFYEANKEIPKNEVPKDQSQIENKEPKMAVNIPEQKQEDKSTTIDPVKSAISTEVRPPIATSSTSQEKIENPKPPIIDVNSTIKAMPPQITPPIPGPMTGIPNYPLMPMSDPRALFYYNQFMQMKETVVKLQEKCKNLEEKSNKSSFSSSSSESKEKTKKKKSRSRSRSKSDSSKKHSHRHKDKDKDKKDKKKDKKSSHHDKDKKKDRDKDKKKDKNKKSRDKDKHYDKRK